MAELRADGLSPATLARRTAAARTFFRHLQLIGARSDNPAAEVALPRRTRQLPQTLSPGEAERLIEAANGTTPRALARPRARRAALRRRPARVGGDRASRRAASTSTTALVRVIGKGGKERVVPVGREAVEALRRYLVARPARTSTGATGPSSS